MASESMSSDQQMRGVAERIETLVGDFAASPDAAVRHKAQELVRQLMTLYGAGLTRILQILELEDLQARRPVGHTAAALRADDLVASLLMLHDLHPEDAETRITRGLERVQPSFGTTVTLLDVRDGAARLKVDAPHQGEGRSMVDLRRLIESVVHAVAPELLRVDIEGLPHTATAPLIQLSRKPLADRSSEIPIP
jgi:hypothetical protein